MSALSNVAVAMGVVFVAGASSACGGDGGGSGGGGIAVPGLLTDGSSFAGRVRLTDGRLGEIAGSVGALAGEEHPVEGTVVLSNGTSLAITGTIDAENNELFLTAMVGTGSWSFVQNPLPQAPSDGHINGSIIELPAFVDIGAFSFLNTTGETAIESFCGAISGDITGGIDITVTDSFATAVVLESDAYVGAMMIGERDGAALRFVFEDPFAFEGTSTGTIDGTSATGDYSVEHFVQLSGTGAWTAGACP